MKYKKLEMTGVGGGGGGGGGGGKEECKWQEILTFSAEVKTFQNTVIIGIFSIFLQCPSSGMAQT